MPKVELDRLSDNSTTWVFGITPALDERLAAKVLRSVEAFLDQWTAHNVPVTAGCELRDGRFLIVAAEANSETSGCSIDKLFGLVRSLEGALGLKMLDANQVFFRDADGTVASTTRSDFRSAATPETVVFDTTAQKLGELRSGAWERPARDSWHAHLLSA